MFKSILMMCVAGLLVAGCANDRAPSISSDFGNAVKTNIALQTINPAGVGTDQSETMDGQKARQAIDEYRKSKGKAEDQSLIKGIGSNE